MGGLYLEAVTDGMKEMLASYGVEVGDSVVMDAQNEPFPTQVQRQVGGAQVYEIQELNYPPFVDVRSDGMDKKNPIVSNLPAVTMHWASPLTLDEAKNANREVTVLLRSTDNSWLQTEVDMQPNPDQYPEYGFPSEGEHKSYPLAVSIRGSFDSFFADKASPFEATSAVTETAQSTLGTVKISPDSARLVVIGSSEFVDDAVLQLSQNLSADRYLNNLQFLQNAVDWSVEDEDLLTIRSRGTYARLLNPLDEGQQSMAEGLNYGLALLSLVVIGVVWTVRRRNERPMALVESSEPEPRPGPEGPGSTTGNPESGGDR
jgi:ABC-2 type transport system permease protein